MTGRPLLNSTVGPLASLTGVAPRDAPTCDAQSLAMRHTPKNREQRTENGPLRQEGPMGQSYFGQLSLGSGFGDLGIISQTNAMICGPGTWILPSVFVCSDVESDFSWL